MEVDRTLDTLLDLHGQVLVLDEKAQYWVKFIARRVPATAEKPHGIDYALTLHGPDGARLVGFDNAHSVPASSGPGGKRPIAQDHKHRLRTIRPYDYRDAGGLLEDFWAEVESVLKEKGVSL